MGKDAMGATVQWRGLCVYALYQVLVAVEAELLAGFREDIGQVCSRADFDGCASQIRGDDDDVRRHGGWCLRED